MGLNKLILWDGNQPSIKLQLCRHCSHTVGPQQREVGSYYYLSRNCRQVYEVVVPVKVLYCTNKKKNLVRPKKLIPWKYHFITLLRNMYFLYNKKRTRKLQFH